MSKPRLKAISLILALSYFELAYADDVEVLSVKQQRCLDKKMAKWQKQREKEISAWCAELRREGEECKTSAGGEALLEEEASKGFTIKCKKLIKND